MKNDRSNTIIIRLGKGTIEDGFSHVNIKLNIRVNEWEDSSNLPPNPELKQLLNEWQLLYPAAIHLLSSGGNLSSQVAGAVFDENTITNVSSQDMVELNHNFRVVINDWLNFGDFGRIGRRLRKDLNISDRFSVIIISEQLKIWQLPWHFWDLFNDYPHAVEVFAKPRFASVRYIKPQCHGRVNILALSGRDPESNLDLSFLKTLPQSKPTFEDQAKSASDIAKKLKQVKPSVWVFYGHGDTIEHQSFQDGIIYLDHNTPLEISRLRLEIQAAIERGLQIVIFNCCNGLGLAEQIVDLNIPYIIVMREIIPNITAQDFLENLLEQYSQGQSFPAAFQFARQQLRLGTGGFAQFADWLPILFHNPLSNSVSWQDLSATAFSRIIPPQIVITCRALSDPKCRLWTSIGVSLFGSLLAIAIQPHPQIVVWENAIVDRVQSTQVKNSTLEPSKIVIINYDDRDYTNPGKDKSGHLSENIVNDDSSLRDLILVVEKQTKPTSWILDLEIDRNPTIFGSPRIAPGCADEHPLRSNLNYTITSTSCDRSPLVNFTLEEHKLSSLVPPEFRLNFNLLNGIDRVNMQEVSSWSSDKIKAEFAGKTILVGFFEDNPTSKVARDAIALDQIIRANDRQHPLPFLVYRSIGQQFVWVFLWSILAGVALWKKQWKLLLPIVVLSQLALAGWLLIMGQGLPLVTTSIAIVTVGSLIGFLRTAAKASPIR
jgi:hypothetical protein